MQSGEFETDGLKYTNYDKLFVFIAEEGERNGILCVKDKITVFHEFFKLFRNEFITDLDFNEFIKEEFKQINQKL